MSAIVDRLPAPRSRWLAWRSLRGGEFGCFMLLGGVLAGMNLLAMADSHVAGIDAALVAGELLQPLLMALVLLAFWLPADRSPAGDPRRIRRLVLAVLLAGGAAAALLPWLIDRLGLATLVELAYRQKNEPMPGWPARFVADFAAMLIPSGLLVAVLEMAGRRRRSEQALAAAIGEQARLAHAALESRLAAMQAQVEPQFLFDVLVDIERLYAAQADGGSERGAAAAQMERLITYLRVALPKLRESGSNLATEVELVASYLDLVRAMRGGRPALAIELPPALRDARFHPMLLLPLIQRAVRPAGQLPTPRRIALRACERGAMLELQLTIGSPALCADDAELRRLRERLQGLYDGRASLQCEQVDASEPGAGGRRCSRFTLALPR